MVDESGTGMNLADQLKRIPTSLNTKPFHIEPGMHHLEKFDDSDDSIEDDIKDANSKAADKRKERLAELQNLGSGASKNGHLAVHHHNTGAADLLA